MELILNIGKFAAAIIVSFLLFVAVSMLHGLFGVDRHNTTPQNRPRIIAEFVKEKPKEEKQVVQRIRQVRTGSQNTTTSGNSGEMSMRFTPDLSADAGGGGAEVALGGKDLSAEVFDEGQTDEPPIEQTMPPVNFPDEARDQGVSGVVLARYTITFEGKVKDVEIVSSPGPLFSNEVRRTLQKARYKPAHNKGIPVNIRATKLFEFNLE